MAVALPTPLDEPAPEEVHRRPRWIRSVLVIWLVVSAVLLAARADAITGLSLADPDDYMRLAEIRDWVDGQSWWDRTQYRLDPPDGVPLHFSRLGDVGVAALVVTSRPVLGASGAERFAIAAYPLLLLGAALFLLAAIGGRLGGPRARARSALLLVAAPISLVQLAPTRIDHHGLQLVLVLVALHALVSSFDTGAAGRAGFAAALSIAVGLEAAPYVAVAAAVVGLRWAVSPSAARRPTIAFAATFGIGVPVLLVTTVSPSEWGPAGCVSLGAAHAVGAFAGGSALTLLAIAGHRLGSLRRRLVALAATGASMLALVAVVFPSCRDGAYGSLDPLVRTVWLARVREAQPLLDRLGSEPALALLLGCLLFAGLVFAALGLARSTGEDRWAWSVAFGFLIAGGSTTLWQIRGAYLGVALAAPVLGAALAAGSTDRHGPLGRARAAQMAVAASFLLPAAAGVVSGTEPAHQSTLTACGDPAGLAALSGLDLGTVMAPIDLASPLLVHTDAQVLAAPYPLRHPGLADQLRLAVALPADAATLAQALGVSTIMICPESSETAWLRVLAPEGLVATLATGATPEWLTPIELPSTPGLSVYAVDS